MWHRKNSARYNMPRFSIKNMLWATLLFAIGVCMLVPQFRMMPRDSVLRAIGLPGNLALLVGGFAAVGGGLLTPFQKTKLGMKLA